MSSTLTNTQRTGVVGVNELCVSGIQSELIVHEQSWGIQGRDSGQHVRGHSLRYIVGYMSTERVSDHMDIGEANMYDELVKQLANTFAHVFDILQSLSVTVEVRKLFVVDEQDMAVQFLDIIWINDENIILLL